METIPKNEEQPITAPTAPPAERLAYSVHRKRADMLGVHYF